jgi:class 3 adenylate cyclase
LAPVFRHHLRQAIARQRVTQTGVTRRELARLTIGFLDLVGSTSLQSQLDPAEPAAQVTRFETRAFDVTSAGGGRLVKFIGNEIMVAALDLIAGCRIVPDLVEAFTDDGTQTRGGLVFGEVLFRHGDYYGPVVNLAARLVDAAIPVRSSSTRRLSRRARTTGCASTRPVGACSRGSTTPWPCGASSASTPTDTGAGHRPLDWPWPRRGAAGIIGARAHRPLRPQPHGPAARR